MSVFYEIQKETTKVAQMLVDGVTSEDVVDLLRTFRPLGFWRLDITTGHVFWSREVFEIYGMEYSPEPVNFVEMNSKFHPDDLSVRLEMLERVAKLKKPFSYILRVKSGEEGYKFIRVAGRYRETEEGNGEFIGVTSIVDSDPRPSSRHLNCGPAASA